MDVAVTIDGSSYTVVQVIPNGGVIYIVAIDASGNFLVIQKSKDFAGFNDVKGHTLIGTGAVAT